MNENRTRERKGEWFTFKKKRQNQSHEIYTKGEIWNQMKTKIIKPACSGGAAEKEHERQHKEQKD